MYINGKFTNGNSVERIPVINPATEEAFADSARGTTEDAFVAIAAAKVAFQEWQRTPANERAAALHAVAAKIRANRDELIRLLTLEEGKPIMGDILKASPIPGTPYAELTTEMEHPNPLPSARKGRTIYSIPSKQFEEGWERVFGAAKANGVSPDALIH